jgi:LPXTG-site transpeptidase (sortase) family protein
MKNEWNIKTHNQKQVKNTQLYISAILAVAGLIVIASQVIPLAKSYIDGKIQETRENIIAQPIPESYKTYIQEEFAYYDPGQSYFANLTQNIDGGIHYTYDPITKAQKEIVIDQEYKELLYLTIDNIGIEHIQISPNVESYDEKIYNSYLKNGLAHFKGTPLPGDGGNSFIYGHSAVASFFDNHKNLPETIFSKLDKVDIGQKVLVEKDDKILEYTIRSKKIVAPDDFTILQTQNNKETVTLMTCWPLGIGTKRLVVTAERDN